MRALVALLLAGAVVLTALHPGGSPVPGPAWALVPLGVLVVAASLLVVRVRAGDQEDSVTLVEAVLAVLLLGYAGPQAVLVTAAAAVVTAVGRRTPLDKSAFNVAQWAFAVAVGSAVTTAVGAGEGVSPRGLLGLGLGLTALWTANSLAFTAVLALSTGRRPAEVLRGLGPVGWLGGFAANAALGLLYALAFTASPAAVLLFPVPLVLLHTAYRGYALARLERQHLAALHRAAQALSAPVDPDRAVPAFLAEVLRGFDAGRAVLVLRTPAGVVVHSAVPGEDRTASAYAQEAVSPLWSALLEHGAPVRVDAGRGRLGVLLAAQGHRSAVSAPVLVGGAPAGCVVVLDRTGVADLPSGELEVLAALAREAGGTFDKGHLLHRMLEDRRRLSEIVGTTSDGIVTVALDGTVTSWNPAMERITGLPAASVVRRPGALAQLHARTVAEVPVDLSRWAQDGPPPAELRLGTPLGERRVTCSYDSAPDDTGAARTLVVVARDVTPVEDLTRLRQQFHRLVEAEAAQRLVVEQLQQAVMPARPVVVGAELGVTYVASDPTSPTGGDLYDCQLLPDGDLHLCVVDVLGHGVGATQDALTVMHTLRTVVLDGTALEDVVARADLLLGRQAPELVATVVLARYTPSTGRLRVASGGHPPALVVTPRRPGRAARCARRGDRLARRRQRRRRVRGAGPGGQPRALHRRPHRGAQGPRAGARGPGGPRARRPRPARARPGRRAGAAGAAGRGASRRHARARAAAHPRGAPVGAGALDARPGRPRRGGDAPGRHRLAGPARRAGRRRGARAGRAARQRRRARPQHGGGRARADGRRARRGGRGRRSRDAARAGPAGWPRRRGRSRSRDRPRARPRARRAQHRQRLDGAGGPAAHPAARGRLTVSAR